jgi:hypothetical protein
MDSKKIVEKSEETIKSLTAVWDELGLEDAVRRQYLTELNKKLETVFEELLTQERNVRDQYKNNIERYKFKIQDICRILEEPQPNLDNINTSGLMNTFVRLAEILEALHRVPTFVSRLLVLLFRTINSNQCVIHLQFFDRNEMNEQKE